MVELQPSKLIVWVRFPSSAPYEKVLENEYLFFLHILLRSNLNTTSIKSEHFYKAYNLIAMGEHGSPLHYFGNNGSFIRFISIIVFVSLLGGRPMNAPTDTHILL